MPRVGFEPTTPVFERTKAVHASDCGLAVIGSTSYVHESYITLQDKDNHNSSHNGLAK
jgi:hypothetical protein